MSITIAAFFTQDNGQPATGLTLAEIALYLTAQDKATLAQTVIWDGSQHPTAETTNAGAYARNYEGDDLATYDYFAAAQYTGARTLDTNWITGSVGQAAVDKTGYTLAPNGLDVIDTTPPAGVAGNWREMVIQNWRHIFGKVTMTASALKHYGADGTTVNTTQPLSDDGVTQTQGEAT